MVIISVKQECPARDGSIQHKLDVETRRREEICKSLSLNSQKDQLIQGFKDLTVCNARITAYAEELQKLKEQIGNSTEKRNVNSQTKEWTPCKGKVALSDIHIPLMWKDDFSNKEGSQRYAVFCLFRMGTEIFDSGMLIIDETVTDICFENVTIFNEAGPDFQVKVELYSYCALDSTPAIAPKTFVKKLRATFKKKIGIAPGNGSDDDIYFNPDKLGIKYYLLAHATLTLEHTDNSFKTHSLTITGNEESSFWLPLCGNMCCRLVAQPACMVEVAFKGFLNQQLMVENRLSWRSLYCVLRGGQLFCYYTPEEIEAKIEPCLVLPFNKETKIRPLNQDLQKGAHRFFIVNIMDNKEVTETFAADSREELRECTDAFRQHIFDFSQWKHCCEELMKIEIMSPGKPLLFLTKDATSVYHDMSIDSSGKPEGKKKIEDTDGQLLIGKPLQPSWGAFFDGTHQIVLQKKVNSNN